MKFHIGEVVRIRGHRPYEYGIVRNYLGGVNKVYLTDSFVSRWEDELAKVSFAEKVQYKLGLL